MRAGGFAALKRPGLVVRDASLRDAPHHEGRRERANDTREEYVAARRRDETIRASDETIFVSTRQNRETVNAY
jgi:hypothetical protein